MWEFDGCEFLDAHNPAVTEVRPAKGSTYFLAGPRWAEQANRFADEIRAMRCAAHACQASMAEMREALAPGMTEREVWSILHAGNIRRAGEWIETQILASGPRTNPWMQETSARTVEAGDPLAYDTDLVGAYGMMVDISRTWLVGDGRASPAQASTHALALEAGMVLTVESYVGPRVGGEGVKLENQVLVTAHGPELPTRSSLALR